MIQQKCVETEERVGQKIAVSVEPLKNFFSAEEYHQKYLDKNPGGYCHVPFARIAWVKTVDPSRWTEDSPAPRFEH